MDLCFFTKKLLLTEYTVLWSDSLMLLFIYIGFLFYLFINSTNMAIIFRATGVKIHHIILKRQKLKTYSI